jgi:hypothetical protein
MLIASLQETAVQNWLSRLLQIDEHQNKKEHILPPRIIFDPVNSRFVEQDRGQAFWTPCIRGSRLVARWLMWARSREISSCCGCYFFSARLAFEFVLSGSRFAIRGRETVLQKWLRPSHRRRPCWYECKMHFIQTEDQLTRNTIMNLQDMRLNHCAALEMFRTPAEEIQPYWSEVALCGRAYRMQ